MKAQNYIIIVMSILLLAAIGYIGYNLYDKSQQNKQITAYATFQQGEQVGYYGAVGQLYQEALKCQPVPITYDNKTINLIAIECPQIQQLLAGL